MTEDEKLERIRSQAKNGRENLSRIYGKHYLPSDNEFLLSEIDRLKEENHEFDLRLRVYLPENIRNRSKIIELEAENKRLREQYQLTDKEIDKLVEGVNDD